MKHFVLGVIGLLTATASNANVECAGKINQIYKTSDMTTLSINLMLPNGTVTTWINLPTNADVAMALMANASGRSVHIYWSASDVTTCSNGWAQNRVLQGFFAIDP